MVEWLVVRQPQQWAVEYDAHGPCWLVSVGTEEDLSEESPEPPHPVVCRVRAIRWFRDEHCKAGEVEEVSHRH